VKMNIWGGAAPLSFNNAFAWTGSRCRSTCGELPRTRSASWKSGEWSFGWGRGSGVMVSLPFIGWAGAAFSERNRVR
jgi:hypothetical protein